MIGMGIRKKTEEERNRWGPSFGDGDESEGNAKREEFFLKFFPPPLCEWGS